MVLFYFLFVALIIYFEVWDDLYDYVIFIYLFRFKLFLSQNPHQLLLAAPSNWPRHLHSARTVAIESTWTKVDKMHRLSEASAFGEFSFAIHRELARQLQRSDGDGDGGDDGDVAVDAQLRYEEVSPSEKAACQYLRAWCVCWDRVVVVNG